MNPPVFGRSSGGSRSEGLLAEFDETVLARETLPTLGENPGRIDASSRATAAGSNTVRHCAISGSRYPQARGQRNLFGSVRQVCADAGVPAYRSGGSPAR